MRMLTESKRSARFDAPTKSNTGALRLSVRRRPTIGRSRWATRSTTFGRALTMQSGPPAIRSYETTGRQLSNTDKHRELATVAVQVAAPGIAYEGPSSDIKFTDKGHDRDLRDGAQVMAFTVTGPRSDEVDVEPMYGYEVRVEGWPLRGSLSRIAWAVWKSVSESETGEPFPVLTQTLFLLLPDRTEFPAAPFFPDPTR